MAKSKDKSRKGKEGKREDRFRQDDRDKDDDNDDHKNEHDLDRIFRNIQSRPAHAQYPELLVKSRPIIELWYETFNGSKFWKKTRRNLPKEWNESAFVMEELVRVVDDYDMNNVANQDKPLTILDMCSGIGYLSMFLSHLLPPHKVSRIIPIDVLFRSHADPTIGEEEEEEEDGKHLSTAHFTHAIHPIPIKPRRANIKSRREMRQIIEHCVQKAPGPVIILGIHLCKALSVHTVRLFLQAPNACRLYLKPCCLPGRNGLKCRHPPFWTFEHMEGGGFGLETLYYCQEVTNTNGGTGGIGGIGGIGGSNPGEDEKQEEDNKQKEIEDHELEEKENGKSSNWNHDIEPDEEEADETKDGQGQNYHGAGKSKKTNNILFTKWVQLLCTAANNHSEPEAEGEPGGDGTKATKTTTATTTAEILFCDVQKNHFQNQYIVATR